MSPRGSLRSGLAALAVTGALVLTGCGSSASLTAAEQVPDLRIALTKVDSALAAHQYLTARRTLASLIAQAQQAQKDGTLSDEAAARIIASARKLFALIPKPVAPKPTPTPTPRASTPTPKKHDEHKKHEKHEKPGKGDDEEGDQPGSTPALTPDPTPTPTPTPTPESTPTEVASPAADTSPTP